MLEDLQFFVSGLTPYDQESWFNLVGDYNKAIWLISPLAFLLTLVLLCSISQTGKAPIASKWRQTPFAVLGVGWFWTGLIFHIGYFAGLNWAALWFGVAFMAQGILLLSAIRFFKGAAWASLHSPRGRLALCLLFIGLIIYPLSGLAESRSFAQLEWFPMLPAPLTLVTFAVLILWKSRWRHVLIIIPFSWAVISAAFAATLDLLEFYFLVGAIAIWLIDLACSIKAKLRPVKR